MKPNKRQISESLLRMLDVGGQYHVITEIVKRDPYLDMEMRGSTGVIVYYRGGKILTINEKNGLITLDKKYCKGDESLYITPRIDDIFTYISAAKSVMDCYELTTSKLGEKEIQQRVVYENNLSVNAKNTDYFIVDVEWADNNQLGGRADIVAFRWDHTIPSHRKRSIQLTLIEVKQGEKAIETTITTDKKGRSKIKPGLRRHYEDYLQLTRDKEYVQYFVNDMIVVLKQKHSLGLINGLDKLFFQKENPVQPNLIPDIDFVFLLANYHYYSHLLLKECKSLPDDCKFCTSSFMGYGLYKDFIFTKKEIIELFPKVFEE